MWNLIRKLLAGRPSSLRVADSAVIGLGNIGNEYVGTRHNVGFEVVDRLGGRLANAKAWTVSSADIIEGVLVGGKPVVLAKPLTYMNRSGTAVAEVLRRFGLPLSKCLVVVDDFNLPLGRLRFRPTGSDGGHNGLKSISGQVGSDFPRLRLGIGPLPKGMGVVDFVLGQFEREEDRHKKDEMTHVAAEAVVYYCTNGMAAAMNEYNSRN
jgi:PTH1 family peptidyl-tRNA hydrolase